MLRLYGVDIPIAWASFHGAHAILAPHHAAALELPLPVIRCFLGDSNIVGMTFGQTGHRDTDKA